MESHEFVKCQGTRLLTSLPAAVRHSLRHYEVAAVIRPFQPHPPLHGHHVPRQFCYAAVTDWSLLLLAMSAKGEAAVLLEIPLLMIEDLDVDSLDVADVASDRRGTVRSSCINIFPKTTSSTVSICPIQQQQYCQQEDYKPHHLHQQQQGPDSPASPLDRLKQALVSNNCSSSSKKPRKFSINRAALVRPPTPQQIHQMDWQAAAAAVAPEFQKHMPVDQQQVQQQRRLTQSIIQQLQVLVQQWQQQMDKQQQQQQWGGRQQQLAGPIAEAIEQCSSATIQQATAPTLAPAGGAGVGVQVPSSKAPWSLMNGNDTSFNPQTNSMYSSSSQINRLKQRLTVDTAVGISAQVQAAGDAAGAPSHSSGSIKSNNMRVNRLKQRLTVDTAALPAAVATVASGNNKLITVTNCVISKTITIDTAKDDRQEGASSPTTSQLRGLQDNAGSPVIQPQQQYVLQQHQQQQQQQQQEQEGLNIDGSYCLQLITVERSSGLFFHIHRAWMGANMRAALTAAAAPGLPAWLPPPTGVFHMQQQQQQAKHTSKQQQQQQQQPGSPVNHLRSLLHGLATPTGSSQCNTPTAAAAAAGSSGVSMSMSGSTSSGDSSSLLSAESQAVLHQDMLRFFGMMRDPLLARQLSGPFPGDTPLWQQQHSHKQLISSHQETPTAADTRPAASAAGDEVGSKASLWENDPLLDAKIKALQFGQQQQQQQQQYGSDSSAAPSAAAPLSAFTPLASANSPNPATWVADYSKLVAQRSAAVAARRRSCPEHLMPQTAAAVGATGADMQQQQQRAKGWSVLSGNKHNKMLRAFIQVGAGVYAQSTASATRELFWQLASGLMKPCSLFDAGDVTVMKQLIVELAFCRKEQVAALQQAFFNSSEILSFLLARMTSWGTLMSLYPEGLPPIQNPAQPGRLEAYTGKPVVWTTALMYPGRPRRLMKGLGLTSSSDVCFRSVLDAAISIAVKHQQAANRAAKASSNSSSSLRQVPLGQTYYADPLNLSPLANLSYLFVANARRMAWDRSSEVSVELGPSHLGGPATDTDTDDAYDSSSADMSSSGTFAEATNVLRWERLMGRVAARLASRKVQLLLYWLQMQLAFTEGCTERRNWLSEKALGPGPRSGLTHISTPWTFRAATQQLLASLLTLNLSGSRSCSKTLIPGGVDDLLWWAQSGAETWVLDYVIGVVYELMGMCEQQESYQAAAGVTAAGFKNFVMEVIREVPAPQLQQLLRQTFLRFICLMGGTAGNREWTTVPVDVGAVLAYKYGSVLLEMLGGVVAAADGLHDEFVVEVQHIMGVPQVQAQLAAAAAGCHAGVLCRNNRALLNEVLTAVGAAVPWSRQPVQSDGLSVSTLGHTYSAMKVQN